MMTALPLSLQNALQEIVVRSNIAGAAIRCILLSTTEGVPLGRCIIDDDPNNNHVQGGGGSSTTTPSITTTNDEVIASIESIWAPASKQYPILGCGRLQQVTAIYDHGTLLQIYQTPLVITILCGYQSNVGAVRSTAVPLLKQVLEPLSRELVNMLQGGIDPDSTTAVTAATSSSSGVLPSYPATTSSTTTAYYQ